MTQYPGGPPFNDQEKALALARWHHQKLEITFRTKTNARRIIRQGGIFECRLGENVGSEINKTRPCP